MKRQLSAILTIGLLAIAAGAQPPGAAPTNTVKTDFSSIFKSDKEKFGYTVGMYYAGDVKNRMKTQDVEFDTEAMIKGFADNLGAGPSLITEDQKKEILADLNKLIRGKAEQRQKEQAEKTRLQGEKNKVEGPAFLAKNETEPGVITLPSGLQYKVITDGAGPIPALGDEVTVNYRGTYIDGTEFDNSIKRGLPLKTKVQEGSVIKGWVEALQHMKTGSKWQVFVPADLAYAETPHNPAMPANAVLIYEMELLSTRPAAQMAQSPSLPAATMTPLTSDIIKVPSQDEINKGAKIETLKAEDIAKEKAKTNQ